MDPIQDLLQPLETAKGDIRVQAALTAEFLVLSRPDEEREPLRTALDAAAVLHWFDAELLEKMLEIPSAEAQDLVRKLAQHSFVEPYRGVSDQHFNLHESTRLGWRTRLAAERPEQFRALSSRASSCFADDLAPPNRIEWIYHLLCGDPELAALELENLDREWSASARLEDHAALATALQELVETKLVDDRARARSLLAIAGSRIDWETTARLAEIAAEALRFARKTNDRSAEAGAQWLQGHVLEAQGDLTQAQAAYRQFLTIYRQLAEQDPSNAGWQLELAVAYGRSGDVLEAKGELTQAQAAFEQYLAISRRLAEQDPSNAGWQRELAVAHSRVGGVLMAQSQPTKGIEAYLEDLRISRRLTEQDPSNARWRRDLALACVKIGRIAAAANLKDIGLPLYEESLRVFAALVKRAPGFVQWAEDMKIVEAELTALRAATASSPDGAAEGDQTP